MLAQNAKVTIVKQNVCYHTAPCTFCGSRWMRKAARRWADWSWKDLQFSCVTQTLPSGQPNLRAASLWMLQ